MLSIRWHGETLRMHWERGLYWPAMGTLFIADCHFGKAAAFQRQGIPIPEGSNRRDLGRLDTLIEAWRPERLVVLGDFFHAPPSPDESLFRDFRRWRKAHSCLDITLLEGNHDRRLSTLAATLSLRWEIGPLSLPPFSCRHEPSDSSPVPTLCGHLHPILRLRTGRERLRVPIFWFGNRQAVLPAFGSFTGGMPVRLQGGDRAFAVGDSAVVPLRG
jgi:DNA ligase-associated metallophosphoesterase